MAAVAEGVPEVGIWKVSHPTNRAPTAELVSVVESPSSGKAVVIACCAVEEAGFQLVLGRESGLVQLVKVSLLRVMLIVN